MKRKKRNHSFDLRVVLLRDRWLMMIMIGDVKPKSIETEIEIEKERGKRVSDTRKQGKDLGKKLKEMIVAIV